MEGRFMGYRDYFQSGEAAPAGRGREQHSSMRSVQNLESVINEGLRVALLEETPDQSLEVLLEHLGKALNGERTYIFERNESGCDDNTYEWTASGVEPEKENLQNVPPEVCASWYRNFSVGQQIVIEDLENIRETDPLQYENLNRQSIHSLVVVPLYDGEKIIGFYGVDNPPVKSMEYASNMLQTAAYFIVSSLKRRNLVRELQKRSYNVLHALSVDYLGIYQVNFDTDGCEIYRDSEQMSWAANFEDGYQAAIERYIFLCVVPRDQDRLRAVTKKEYVLAQLRTRKKFYVRYQVRDNPHGLNHLEIHFSATGRTEEENCVIFALRDVNAVVEQEEKYRLEARRSLEEILEGARTGIWTIELEEGCQPRMYTDRTMRILLGVPDGIEPEECYRHWFASIEPDYVEMVQEAVREILEAGRAEVIYPWNHPKLGKIYVRCGGVPDKTFKKPGVCLSGYHQDITETMVTRKKQEQAIMELLEKVRRANSAKSEFLSHMSHDLRTPINGIMGMLAIQERTQNDARRQRECRKKIRMSAEHLLSLVNDVLEISKLDSGRPAAVEEPFDLHDILDGCFAILSAQAEEAEVQLVLEESGLRHSRLVGNPLHLKQILMNVIDNAIRYNRPGGSVFVRVKEITCGNETASCQFVIEDTGIGMGEDFKPHIFEPFTQEHQGARTHYGGVGLGMSIVKKLVDQMQGAVAVDSQPGRGSVVQITLPIRADQTWSAPPAEEDRGARDNIAGMRVLLVEDNEINCEIVEFMLKEAGAEVVTASDGKAAVDAFAASVPGEFHCVLMDLMMPVMSGYEAARVIRSLDRPDAETVPIIALSANAFEEDVALAKGAGMNEHLAKPVDIRKMFQVMKRLSR
ncbi:MAG: response regulator [Oscillospiraceae bacterium]|jgi:signal transduction histidine kinase/ActR/RegA family two-component response regulator|nr:response regulator [Oscillospiraceae bacterium]